MSNTITIPVSDLRAVLRLDSETGELFWRERPSKFFTDGKKSAEGARNIWNGRFAGKQAGITADSSGYLQCRIFDRGFRTHRVVWALHTGAWPVADLDHVNGIRHDNRPENLREATRFQNGVNRRSAKGSSSRFLGVSLDKNRSRWRAVIRQNGSHRHLGYFRTEEEAAAAYRAAAEEYHGDFAAHVSRGER